MNRSLSYYSKEQQRAAKSWWHSQAGTQRRYLNKHFNLGDPARLTRYWINNIAPQQSAGSQS